MNILMDLKYLGLCSPLGPNLLDSTFTFTFMNVSIYQANSSFTFINMSTQLGHSAHSVFPTQFWIKVWNTRIPIRTKLVLRSILGRAQSYKTFTFLCDYF